LHGDGKKPPRVKPVVGSREKNDIMNIIVNGCVTNQGSYDVPIGATVGDAMHIAGGFGGQGMQPTGVIAVRSRRKTDGKYYCRRRLDYKHHPEHLKIVLQSDDLLIVQFEVNQSKR
jgi:protein involved in polysaccharide export with SLBB domain